MNDNPKPENLAKLTPEQLKIYQGWVKEREDTNKLLDLALDFLGRGMGAAAKEAFVAVDNLIPDFCEHGTSIWEDCRSCDDIWRTLYPEQFDGASYPNPKLN